MKINYLDGKRLYYAFLAGTKKVIANKNDLNKINLFPVADGDTGSNLAHTLKVVENETIKTDSLAETLNSMGEAALKGAIGNSGIIFAQFINGLKNSAAQAQNIDTKEFVEIVKKSVAYTYQGLNDPVEGTILTVMKDWAVALEKIQTKTKDFAELINESLKTASNSLAKTKNQLQVLKEANVVDSGAQAFVFFLEGIVDFINNGNLKKLNSKNYGSIEELIKEEIGKEEKIEFRYCTEAYLAHLQISIKELKLKISEFGDSLIIAGDRQKLRLHIHTNKPPQLFLKLDQFADILDQKVDDMQLQQQVKYNKKSEIAILTDSIADLPAEFRDKYQIHLLPLNILIDETNYLDKLTIDTNNFFDIIDDATEYPSSAQPAVKKIEDKLNYLAENYQAVIAITVSAKMSGTYSSIKKAATNIKNQAKDFKLEVIDSKTNSGAQGLFVLEAAEQLEKGKNFEQIIKYLKSLRDNLYIYVSVSDFKYMVRGGRVSPLKGKLAGFLNLKPIISIDQKGNGIAFATAFSKKGNYKKIKSILKKHQQKKGVKRFAIVHGDDLNRAKRYRESFSELLGIEAEFLTKISPIVALNAGRGSTAIALIEKNEEEIE
ncbi:DAK2 domain-containing protein [Halanaerobium praevalens]|uniref:DegV family protein n=1 Tax=Halanaerobium praevalens (strain ATCC 33744 / DSM 2228 / GSL) TaxID=572479 RepID=E3DPC3_HALPG|nr:DegV family protein [Halanaerobium praevalens]ADO76674.1 degV family protein [Halanaerobium praevalens DSM 2228]